MAEDEDDYSSSSRCLSHIVDESTSLKKLTPNQFYKICPTSGPLGTPICGDGSEFCFYISRPTQRGHNDRLLIEVMGGGACWDEQTCNKGSERLYVNSQFDSFLGLSCSEIQVLGVEANGKPINMLCASSLGETDLTKYTTIIVPYCTQDVHFGSNTMNYDGTTIYHAGANNLMAVMKYVFRNFSQLSSVALTGCSAGGTAVPAVYRILDNHYNSYTRKTPINLISDSPVYLTPQYFLENALGNWNPNVLFQRIGIPYQKYKDSQMYSTLIWDFILRKGSNRDRWGFVSHVDDPVSQIYYQWMSGNGGDGDDQQRRRLEDSSADEWYQQLTDSISTIQSKHKNVDAYWIDNQGHCSFGFYYALQDDGFAEWAGNIFAEQNTASNKYTAKSFGLALVLGVGLIYLLQRHRRQLDSSSDGLLQESQSERYLSDDFRQRLSSLACFLEPFCITAGYALSLTVYFCFLISEGLAHPLNNPTIGPNAVVLSSYGINNPSLIVTNHQWYRLFSSSLLCSGILTYAMTIANLWFRVRHFEMRLQSSERFACLALAISLCVNVVYCLVPWTGGASCASEALVVGLYSCYLCLFWEGSWSSVAWLLAESLLVAVVVPFNSWVMTLTALLMGPLILVLPRISSNEQVKVDDEESAEPRLSLSKNQCRLLSLFAIVLIPVVLLVAANPNPLYLDPFYTGCTLYWSDQIGDLADGSFLNYDDDGDQRRRRLFDYDGVCAQFCLPNLVSPFVRPVTRGFRISYIQKGQCIDQGYETHVLDKTFQYLSYSLDAEIFYPDDYQYQDGDGRRVQFM